MPAVNYNFIIEQGSDFEINFQYNDENNNPVDLSNSQNSCVVLQMIPNSGVDATTSFSTTAQASNYSLIGSDKGLITLKLDNSLTKLYAFDNAVYDLDLIQGTKVIRLVSGSVTIQKRRTPFPSCQISQTNTNTGTGTGTGGENTGGDTPTPTTTPLPDVEDLCLKTDCLDVDIYSKVYEGSSLQIPDLSSVSGSVSTTDTRQIENVELVINNLNHSSPQDLQLLLAPPSGNKILLAGNHKISNNSNNFSFMFSNKALPTSYLHNVSNGNLCNIYNNSQKINSIKYSNETLAYGFDHLFGNSVTGVWNLIVKDTDPTISGSIGGWKLVLTYKP
jgi:subtilisin-like proprotein convertase family protein